MTLITVDTKLMPILPLMLRPEAKKGLVIAFGMGTAFRASLVAGTRTDAVELVPSVPGMFHWFYQDADRVLADPNGRVIVADGRNHVELTDETYDFVVVDPPPPIESSGVSVISSLEFYQASKARLNPGGVMVQWVPYGQTLDEFLAHVRTFLQVFPNVRVVAGAGGYGFYMIGSDGSVDLAPAAMKSALQRPGVLADLDSAPDSHRRSIDAWVATILGNTWASGDRLRDGGRRRAPDHGRPSPPRVLPPPPARRPGRTQIVLWRPPGTDGWRSIGLLGRLTISVSAGTIQCQRTHPGGSMHPILAYIDPGSGSLAIQAVIAALVAAPFVLRTQIARVWHRVRGEERATATASAPADTDSKE